MFSDFELLSMNILDIADLLHISVDDLEKLESAILKIASNQDTPFHDISRYFFASKGKKIRALLTISIAKVLSGSNHALLPDNVFHAAVAIEMIHNSTLLHDDVIDNTQIRRNTKSVNDIWGNKSSILFGDFLIVKSLQTLLKCENLEIISIIANASMMMTIGELDQMNAVSKINDIDIERYMYIIEMKTATLFSAACSIGAIVVNADREYIEKAAKFGKSLGIGFQIMDDLIDYTSDVSGKTIGNDFLEKKVTLPIILSYLKSDTQEKQFLVNAMDSEVDNSSMLQQTLFIMKKYNVFDDVRKIACQHIKDSKDIFHSLLSLNEYWDVKKSSNANHDIGNIDAFFEFLMKRDF